MLTVERARELFAYNSRTGEITWRVARSGRTAPKPGDRAGKSEGRGYWTICADGRGYKAHRVAWLLHYGIWPPQEIDHIDGDKQNNAIANLRAATPSQNKANMPRRSDNRSGFKGVTRHRYGKWMARCGHKYIGLFDTAELAHAAYCAAASDAYGEFARAA